MGKRENLITGGLSALLGERDKHLSDITEPKGVQENVKDEPEKEDLINTIEDEELKEALHRKRMEKRGRPRKDEYYRQKESELYVRTTFIMNREQLAKLREISFRETITMKDIIAEIIGEAIKVYERKNGPLHPKEHKGDPTKLFK